MEVFNTKDGKTIKYDNGSVTVIDVKELEAQKELLETQIVAVTVPSDKELLAWAKANYPITDTSVAKEALEEINLTLESIK